MEYTGIIALSEYGFYIDTHLMAPVGVKDNYRVWGCCEKGDHNRQIILSPLPQKSWRSLINIRVRVKETSYINNVIEYILDENNFIYKKGITNRKGCCKSIRKTHH